MTWLLSLFANPWTLLWLPAAAAPLLIHLWNRRKYREIRWAAMEYLLAAIVKSSRRMRIEQLLLLMVRTLLLLLVIFALAEPFLSTVASPFRAGDRTHRVIVIDGSYSMAYQPSDMRAFDIAKQRAVEIVEQGREGDGYSLILMTDQPRTVVATATFNQDEFIREIEKLKLVHGGADLDAGLKAAEDVIEGVRREQRQLTRHHVYFLSDLGRNTWASEGKGQSSAAEREQQLERLGNYGSVEVMAIGNRRGENLAVTELRTAEPFATISQPVSFYATVRNFAGKMRQQHQVELWVDGRRTHQQFIDIPAGEMVPVLFKHRFHTPGDHFVEALLSGDPLAIDNRRFLALTVKEHLVALLVSGKRQATLPIEAAMDGGNFEHGRTGTIRPEVVPESKLLELELAQYDCIFLCNIGQLTSGEARALSDYLQQGGGLVTILGDQVIPQRYNRELFDVGEVKPEDANVVLPARLGKAFYDGEYHFVDPLNYRHRMLAKWKGNPKTGLATVPVVKFIRLELPENSKAEVVLAMDTGDPLVVESAIGSGRSVIVATDVSTTSVVDAATQRPWSLFASWLNSQPFLEGLWKTAVGGGIDQRNIQVGETFGAGHKRSTAYAEMHVRLPVEPPKWMPVNSTPDGARWTFSQTDVSGVYRVSVRADNREVARESGQTIQPLDTGNGDMSVNGDMIFAVNVDTDEGDLDKLNPEDLPSGFNVRNQWEDTGSAPVEFEQSSVALHQILLCTVLVLLFCESFLAWWIGHRSA